MLTAMYAADNIVGQGGHDLWSVNVDEDYHEETTHGTGRDAPVLPTRRDVGVRAAGDTAA